MVFDLDNFLTVQANSLLEQQSTELNNNLVNLNAPYYQPSDIDFNDGVNKMQESIPDLRSSLQSNQALQASALVGRKVLVHSDALTLSQEADAKAAVDIPAGVSELIASVYSELDELIRKIPLGQQTSGLCEFYWNGFNQTGQRMPAGRYRIKVNGVYSAEEIVLKTMTAANVDSVSLGENGEDLKLNVAGIGAISLNDVKQITG